MAKSRISVDTERGMENSTYVRVTFELTKVERRAIKSDGYKSPKSWAKEEVEGLLYKLDVDNSLDPATGEPYSADGE